jgi:hypothetical protein
MASFASLSDSGGGSPASVHRQPSDGSDDGEAAPNPSQEIFTRLGGAPPQKAAMKQP